MKHFTYVLFLLAISIASAQQTQIFNEARKIYPTSTTYPAITETDISKFLISDIRVEKGEDNFFYSLKFRYTVKEKTFFQIQIEDNNSTLSPRGRCFNWQGVLPVGTNSQYNVLIDVMRCNENFSPSTTRTFDYNNIKSIKINLSRSANSNVGVTYVFTKSTGLSTTVTSTNQSTSPTSGALSFTPYSGVSSRLLQFTSEPSPYPTENTTEIAPKLKETRMLDLLRARPLGITPSVVVSGSGNPSELWISTSGNSADQHRFTKTNVKLNYNLPTPMCVQIVKGRSTSTKTQLLYVVKENNKMVLYASAYENNEFQSPTVLYNFNENATRAEIKKFDWNLDGTEDFVVVLTNSTSSGTSTNVITNRPSSTTPAVRANSISNKCYVFESNRTTKNFNLIGAPFNVNFLPSPDLYVIGRFYNTNDKFHFMTLSVAPPVVGSSATSPRLSELNTYAFTNALTFTGQRTSFKKSTELPNNLMSGLNISSIHSAYIDSDGFSDLLICDNTANSTTAGRVIVAYSNSTSGDQAGRLQYQFSEWHNSFGFSNDEIIRPAKFQPANNRAGGTSLIAYKKSNGEACIAYSDITQRRFNGAGVCPLRNGMKSPDLFLADLNGDAIDDVLCIKKSSLSSIGSISSTAPHIRNVTPVTVQPLSTEQVRAEGPKDEKLFKYEDESRLAVSAELSSSTFYQQLPIFNVEVYEDKNPMSGVYYYKPYYHRLVYDQVSKKFDVRIQYMTTEGTPPSITFGLTDGIGTAEKSMIIRYLKSLGCNVKELRRYPRADEFTPTISSDLNLQTNFSVIRDPRSREFDIVKISGMTEAREDIERFQGAITDAIYGSFDDKLPFIIDFKDGTTLGLWQISKSALRGEQSVVNPYPFPVKVKALHMLAYGGTADSPKPIVYSYKYSGTERLNPDETVKLSFSNFPSWIANSSDRLSVVWLEYEIDADMNSVEMEDLLTGLVESYFQSASSSFIDKNLEVSVLGLFESYDLYQIKFEFFSKNFSNPPSAAIRYFPHIVENDSRTTLQNKLWRKTTDSDNKLAALVGCEVTAITVNGEAYKHRLDNLSGIISFPLWVVNKETFKQWFPNINEK